MKSTVEQIRQRFDEDVERFSDLETGQSATMDAPLSLELVVQAATATNPTASHVLDIGCGAGNYTLKLLQSLPNLNATLVDLSQPMLERAVERVIPATAGRVVSIQSDMRQLKLAPSQFDVILAGATLHHLREEAEWQQVFGNFYQWLKPGGSLWIVDFITHSIPQVQKVMWQRFGQYLTQLKDEKYRDHVFSYIEEEDTPRPLMYQIDLLREVGFGQVEVLHKNNCFAAFGGIK